MYRLNFIETIIAFGAGVIAVLPSLETLLRPEDL